MRIGSNYENVVFYQRVYFNTYFVSYVSRDIVCRRDRELNISVKINA